MYRNIDESAGLTRQGSSVKENALPKSSSVPSTSSSMHTSPQVGSGQADTLPSMNNRLLLFCDIVLKHTGYPSAFYNDKIDRSDEGDSSEELKHGLYKNERISSSPLNSVGESGVDSTRSCSSITGSELAELDNDEYDQEAYESVSCWCGQPFEGRPMIECDSCDVWYHMACEEVHESHVPEHFMCKRCRNKNKRKRPSNATRKGSKRGRRPSAPKGESFPPPNAEPPPMLQMEMIASTPATSSGQLEPRPRAAFPITSPNVRPGKKRGRKKNKTVDGPAPFETNGLKPSEGTPDQSVPGAMSQAPPTLPCYATASSASATVNEPQLRVFKDQCSAATGSYRNNESPSPCRDDVTPPSTIPVLEPQIKSSDEPFILQRALSRSEVSPVKVEC